MLTGSLPYILVQSFFAVLIFLHLYVKIAVITAITEHAYAFFDIDCKCKRKLFFNPVYLNMVLLINTYFNCTIQIQFNSCQGLLGEPFLHLFATHPQWERNLVAFPPHKNGALCPGPLWANVGQMGRVLPHVELQSPDNETEHQSLHASTVIFLYHKLQVPKEFQ